MASIKHNDDGDRQDAARWPRGAQRAARCALFCLAALACGHAALAASPLAEQARALVATQAVAGGDVEVIVGEPDPRLDLAACRRAEPFVPPGARLWGKTSLGVRCVDGATWTVYLPTQIKVFANATVAARPIGRGQAVTADDLRQERVELSLYPPGALVADGPLEGRIALRAIAAGEPMRRDLVRSAPVVLAGEMVRVVAIGPGFSVEAEGKALAMATDGQSVQASLAGGRVVTGVARAGKRVEVR